MLKVLFSYCFPFFSPKKSFLKLVKRINLRKIFFYSIGLDIHLPPKGHYATGILFLDQNESHRDEIIKDFEVQAAELGLQILVWRKVPTDSSCLGMKLVIFYTAQSSTKIYEK